MPCPVWRRRSVGQSNLRPAMTRLIAVILFCAGIFCLVAEPPVGQSHAQVPMTGAGLGAPTGGGGPPPTWTATGNPVAQNTGTTSVTFSGVAVGSPAASDVIVAVYSSESSVASGITCNGNAMTKRIEESTSISGLQIWSITASAAGITGLATTTFIASSGGSMTSEVIQVGKLTGVNPTPPNSGANASSLSIAVTVPSPGFAIVGAYSTPSFSTVWGGGTQDFETGTATGALYTVNATVTGTVSQTGTPAGDIHLAYAAWGP